MPAPYTSCGGLTTLNPVAVTVSGVQDVDPVELGLELLASLEHDALSVAAALDRIETITTDPNVQREILDTAVARGVVEREDGTVRPTSHDYVSFETDVITKEGEFTCRRCSAEISTGYFITFDAGEHGPFGSSCIRKVTGRET
ncbi:hypothetical protein SAMN05216218_107129 [Halorientalis regularis]|jgi:hypothetical protein|uniref:Uncharacterized protein n=1 Tax=Halorientalis regularis TaxID=660518 RepID=A0A1G7M5X6_9EURY|nr:hypothetical protein SAMN05216218_107129 [Halorientalis regularis]